ncbi:MAG TPA: mechanosensitive ion channel family protein [Thermoanaerobaculia bacterium]|nr:mechanosensitive ion channel family protein [Thermoanaerobaculia bacterium]
MALDADTLGRALATELLGNSAADWLEAAGITLALLLAVLLAKRLLRRRFAGPQAAATGVPVVGGALASGSSAAQDLVQELTRRTRWALLLLPAVFLGALALVLSPHVYALLRTLAVLALLLQVALWGTVGIELWVSRTRRRRLAQDGASVILIGSLNFIMRLVLWVLIALLALDNLGVNVTALVAGLGVGGIAVALALQNVLGDILASMSIAADKPFEIGDTIQIDSFVGTVEDVGWRTTRLRSLSGEQLIFANGDMLKSRIRNHKRMTERRVVLAFGVDYKTKADQVEKIPVLLRGIVEAQPGVRFDRAHFKGFGQGSLDLEAVFYFTNPDYNLYMDAQQAILLALMRALEREGISLAQPDRTLWIAAETEPPVPRPRQQPASSAVRS